MIKQLMDALDAYFDARSRCNSISPGLGDIGAEVLASAHSDMQAKRAALADWFDRAMKEKPEGPQQ